jgi:hypothetical protein
MEIAHIQTPLGIAKITENGISSISVSDEGTISIAITCFTSGYSTQRIL